MEILKDLFDKKVIGIISIFLENPEKQYSLTDISNLSKVNVATTFRILNKLMEKKFIKTILVGRVRIHQLEKNEKVFALAKLLKKDNTPIQAFINEISQHPRLKRVILESKHPKEAKLLLIGDFLPLDKINKTCEKIKNINDFKIEFVDLSEKQYDNLKNFKSYDLENKVIWKKNERTLDE